MSGNSLIYPWLELFAFIAEGTGSIPDQRSKITQAKYSKKKKN